ncbi:hypothetical protein KJ564_04745 [bacterium]|nr:hypothetical protein [bacterium]
MKKYGLALLFLVSVFSCKTFAEFSSAHTVVDTVKFEYPILTKVFPNVDFFW